MSNDSMVVSIGRNVGASPHPLSDGDWLDFQDAIEHALFEVYAPHVYFRGLGEGHTEQWGREEVFTLIVQAPHYSDFRENALLALERVRRSYGQEAVAVTEGPTSFV